MQALKAVCYAVAVVLLPLTAGGCGGSGGEKDDLRREVAELRKELADLKKASVEGDVGFLTRDMLLGMEKFYETHAILDCSSEGFAPVEEGGKSMRAGGYFLVSCDNAETYLNGHRLTLRVGNPQAATYTGLKLTVHWGKALPEKDLWEVGWRGKELASLARKSFDISNRFPAGSWTTVHVVLTPSRPEDLSVIVVKIDTGSVRLAG